MEVQGADSSSLVSASITASGDGSPAEMSKPLAIGEATAILTSCWHRVSPNEAHVQALCNCHQASTQTLALTKLRHNNASMPPHAAANHLNTKKTGEDQQPVAAQMSLLLHNKWAAD